MEVDAFLCIEIQRVTCHAERRRLVGGEVCEVEDVPQIQPTMRGKVKTGKG